MRTKPTKGQQFIVRNLRDGSNITATVETVGRKYFTLSGFWRQKFYNDTWMEVTEYSSQLALYASQAEIDEQARRAELMLFIDRTLHPGIPAWLGTDGLQDIADIINWHKAAKINTP